MAHSLSRGVSRLALAAVLGLCALPASAADRVTTPLAEGWTFFHGDPEGAETAAFDDGAWTRVSVPHDWAIPGPFDIKARAGGAGGFLPTGIGWYRKTLDVKPPGPGRRIYVELDGVMERSGVWINGHHLGHRPSGYVGLRYDITDFIKADGRNVLAVRADTEHAPSSRWYAGSGVYGKVRLIESAAQHVEQGGAFVSVTKIAGDKAVADIAVDVVNDANRAAKAGIEVVLRDPAGKEVARGAVPAVAIDPARTETLKLSLDIASPKRWDLATPNLYRAEIRVTGEGGQGLDAETVPFGVREAAFKADSGFWLNGRNVKLKGVAVHMDGGAVGAAVPMDVWRQRLAALKAQGVNAIRTAHNPPSPGFLDLCDQMGFVVMDELFDQWNVSKTPGDYHLFFSDWHKRDARDMVRRDRNHPSIVVWSAGNEIHDTAYPVQAKAALTSLLNVMHATDPTRPVTMGLFRPNVTGDYQNGFADMLDVVGQNYRENELIAAHKQNPARIILGTENSKTRTSWVAVRDYPAYSGMFLWTGIDYLGEADRSGWPNIDNPAGIVDRTGALKIVGMQRASWWSETPVLHVVRNALPAAPPPSSDGAGPAPALPTMVAVATPPPKVAVFDDWTPQDLSPHEETIEVYSNCASVDVSLNGRWLGAKALPADASPRQWTVTFAPGEVKAACRDPGVKLEDVLRTAGKPARIELIAESDKVGTGFDELAFVRARVVDAKGVVVPSADDAITFQVSGAGAFVAADNAAPTDHAAFASPTRKAWQGKAVALVRGAGEGGSLTVTATAPGLVAGKASLKVVSDRAR
ncbi:glycoside hydrolase family 2 [Caulobacter flavus]|uniref:Glycoside hydrolase family 2 n=1 Tax=Caulobacter flavus TaxID=1679497 RepID=A0A2N5CTI0_9CAUL|nr:glycoside hydrolase family 2 TIM barrel-domain containing protein [Caulobacter flavus]AYV47760.1 glycoside hydrolase family 2 [Caulobacter flavus]PLR15364.1 glycoside hydrolase family 2 [Caulobacter flavus]